MSKRNKNKNDQVNTSDTQLKKIVQQEIRGQFYQGPMPHPDMMAKYEQLQPGMIDFFKNEVKKQTDHRIEIENKVTSSNIGNEKRGSWFAFIIAMTSLIGGFFLIGIGKTGYGIFISFSTLFALAAAFVTGKFRNTREMAKKREKLLNQNDRENK